MFKHTKATQTHRGLEMQKKKDLRVCTGCTSSAVTRRFGDAEQPPHRPPTIHRQSDLHNQSLLFTLARQGSRHSDDLRSSTQQHPITLLGNADTLPPCRPCTSLWPTAVHKQPCPSAVCTARPQHHIAQVSRSLLELCRTAVPGAAEKCWILSQ